MPRFHSLPDFEETLEQRGLAPGAVYQALADYQDLATELLLEQSPQLDPFGFLRLRDQRDTVAAFLALFTAQSPHLEYGEPLDEEPDE